MNGRELEGRDWLDSRGKRYRDISISSAILPIALPMATVAMAAFAIETRLNPLFVQERVGRNDKLFNMVKLRTMMSLDDFSDRSEGFNDKRASPVGRQMRRLTIDESPQLAQILAGQMSVVGPRPLVSSEVEATLKILSPKKQDIWRHARAVTKPGLMSDYANATRTMNLIGDDVLRARVEMDIQYAETASFRTDCRIIKEALRIGKLEIGAECSAIGKEA